MNKRIPTEATYLTEFVADNCEAVACDVARKEIVIQNWKFPPGWTPATADILIGLPDTYPYEAPVVYVPDELRVHGRTPLSLMQCELDGWNRYLLGWPRMEWDPKQDTLLTVMRRVLQSLTDYSEDDAS